MKCFFCHIDIPHPSNNANPGTFICHHHSVAVINAYYTDSGRAWITYFSSLNNEFIIRLELIGSPQTIIYTPNYLPVLNLPGYPLTPENMESKLPLYLTFS